MWIIIFWSEIGVRMEGEKLSEAVSYQGDQKGPEGLHTTASC